MLLPLLVTLFGKYYVIELMTCMMMQFNKYNIIVPLKPCQCNKSLIVLVALGPGESKQLTSTYTVHALWCCSATTTYTACAFMVVLPSNYNLYLTFFVVLFA